MQELMKDGRKGVKEIDGTLNRAEKLVEDTLQIGQQVKDLVLQVSASVCSCWGRWRAQGPSQATAAHMQPAAARRTQACALLPPSCSGELTVVTDCQ
jgi:hypothetical protein